MTTDQRTANLGLPLPHPNNDLSHDVLRLRDALAAIDRAVGADTTLEIIRDETGAIVQLHHTRASGNATTVLTRSAGRVTSVATTTGDSTVTTALTRDEAGRLTQISRTEEPAT